MKKWIKLPFDKSVSNQEALKQILDQNRDWIKIAAKEYLYGRGHINLCGHGPTSGE